MDRRVMAAVALFSIACAAIFCIRCASTGPVTPSRIKKELSSIQRSIGRDRGAIEGLGRLRMGRSGFYYVVDGEGRVVFHPQSALIGSSFKNHWFINRIISEGTGCISFRLGNRTHLVFFERINDFEVLCFSILADEMARLPGECRTVDPEPDLIEEGDME